jgi:anti-sigma-K factor RskA
MDEPMTPEERGALAAELALGVLDGPDRARALRLQLADPGFAAEVEAWVAQLGDLHLGFDDAPPRDLWDAIAARIEDPSVVALEARLRRWRWGAIGSGLIAASFAAALILRPVPPQMTLPPAQAVVAQLGDANGTLLAANYDSSTGQLRVRAVSLPASKLSPELWVIPADGVPRSLGLVGARGVTELTVAQQHRAYLQEGSTLAVTLEPAEGAPHMKPSSKPIAAGKISTI